jgi:hypothetical protein
MVRQEGCSYGIERSTKVERFLSVALMQQEIKFKVFMSLSLPCGSFGISAPCLAPQMFDGGEVSHGE